MSANNHVSNYPYNHLKTPEVEQKLVSEFSLRNMIDVKVLQDIQEKLAKVTGLAMVTVDLQGQPITKETSFCEYCITRRHHEAGQKSCFFSDAYGGLRASMTNAPYVYYCPAGLTDCAIPIVFNGQYMGTIVIGQVRTLSDEELDSLKNLIKVDDSYQEDPEMLELYERVPVMQLQKLKLTGDLILFLVKEMLEKQLLKLVQKEFEEANQRLVYENFIKDVEIDQLKHSEKSNLKSELRPQMMMSILNSVNNLSMIEGAELTNELICLFAETIRFSFQQNKEFVPLRLELENIERYLQIQQICFNNHFTFDIDIKCNVEEKKILSLVLLPFVENAIAHGLVDHLVEGGGYIGIQITETEDDYLISIKDNGAGLSHDKVEKLIGDTTSYEQERDYGGLSILNTRKRLIRHYGKEFDIALQSNEGAGLTVVIRIPTKEMG